MSISIFDTNETPYDLLNNMEKKMIQINSKKYDSILLFVNRIAKGWNKKYSSLCEFKNVNKELIESNYSLQIMDKYGLDLAVELDAPISVDFNELTTCDIIIYLRGLLKIIKYSITRKIKNKKHYYSIIRDI